MTHLADTAASGARASDGQDWQTFSAARVPERRRHDLEAVTEYGAYRREGETRNRLPAPAGGRERAASRQAGSTALLDWEDEGGAAPSA